MEYNTEKLRNIKRLLPKEQTFFVFTGIAAGENSNKQCSPVECGFDSIR